MRVVTDATTFSQIAGMRLTLMPEALPDLLEKGVSKNVAVSSHAAALRGLMGAVVQMDGVPFATRFMVGTGVEVTAVESSHPAILAGRIRHEAKVADDARLKSLLKLSMTNGDRKEIDALLAAGMGTFCASSSNYPLHVMMGAPILEPGADFVCAFRLVLDVITWTATWFGPRYATERPADAEPIKLTAAQRRDLDALVQMRKKRRETQDYGAGLMGQAILEFEDILAQDIPFWQIQEMVKAELDKMPYWLARIGTAVDGKALYARGYGGLWDKGLRVTNDPALAMPFYVEEQAVTIAESLGGKAELIHGQ